MDWSDYRKVKHRLVALLAMWIPFGMLIGILLPIASHIFTITYVSAIIYALYGGFTWLQYSLFPCPKCGNSYRGKQLWRRTCPNCGIEINK